MTFAPPIIEPISPIPPIEIPNPGGGTTRLPIERGIPTQGVPFPLPWTRDPNNPLPGPSWADVWDYISEPFKTGPQPVQLNLPAVIEAFQKPMERQLQATATYTNLLADYLEQVAIQQITNDLRLLRTTGTLYQRLNARLNRQRATIRAILDLAIPSLQAQIIAARTFSYQLSLNTAQAMKVWTYESIFVPLATEIATERVARQKVDHRIITQDIPAVHADLLTKLAATTAIATGAATVAAKVATWVAECGGPMCDAMGPKTDLGKLLKLIHVAGMLALIAELAALDEHGLESLLAGLQRIGAGVIDDFDTLFVGGGGTLGETITRAGG